MFGKERFNHLISFQEGMQPILTHIVYHLHPSIHGQEFDLFSTLTGALVKMKGQTQISSDSILLE